MINLINLLPWQAGYSGFGTYINRVVPDIDGLRLQVNEEGEVDLIKKLEWSYDSPPLAKKHFKNFLQKASLLQFGFNSRKLIKSHN